jgi:hypothetical protein
MRFVPQQKSINARGDIVIFIITYLPWTITYLPSLIPK